MSGAKCGYTYRTSPHCLANMSMETCTSEGEAPSNQEHKHLQLADRMVKITGKRVVLWGCVTERREGGGKIWYLRYIAHELGIANDSIADLTIRTTSSLIGWTRGTFESDLTFSC